MYKKVMGILLVLVFVGAVFVGCDFSSGNGNGSNGVPPIDEPCEYCDNDTRPTTAERDKAGLQKLIDGWIDAEKCVCYNIHGWEGLQAALGMAQKVLDNPVNDEQIEIAVDLFVEAIGWLWEDGFWGIGDRQIIINMTVESSQVESSQNDRIFTLEDFGEIDLYILSNWSVWEGRRSLSLILANPSTKNMLYTVTLLRIRKDVYIANFFIHRHPPGSPN